MSDKKNIAISVNGVSKNFKLPHEKNLTLKSSIVNFWKVKKGYEIQEALKNVSFEIEEGEFFGIVGRNGSGKSTLLKLLAGIYTPTTGTIEVNGKLTPFIELGVGFSPELTGRENIYLNGSLLGFNRKEMQSMYQEIVDFAELERFMDQKLKNYSSGMQVRLAFSIAIRVKSSILVFDEVLAVGDENFQRKCIATFRKIKNSGTTVVFVSHDMATVERFCNRVLLLENGKQTMLGTSYDVAQRYRELNQEVVKEEHSAITDHEKVHDSEGLGLVDISTRVLDPEGNSTGLIKPNEQIIIETIITAKDNLKDLVHSFTFEDVDGRTVCQFSTDESGKGLLDLKKNEKRKFITKIDNVLSEGTYYIDPDVSTMGREIIYGHVDNASKFDIVSGREHPTLLRPAYSTDEAELSKKSR